MLCYILSIVLILNIPLFVSPHNEITGHPKTAMGMRCYVGYGQRGLQYSSGIQWQKFCPNTRYCYEVVTDEIEKISKLFDYQWDEYYYQFWIRGCGGDFGLPAHFHKKDCLKEGGENPYDMCKYIEGEGFKINVTVDGDLNSPGGTEEFDLNYICRKEDYCVGAAASTSVTVFTSIASIAFLIFVMVQ